MHEENRLISNHNLGNNVISFSSPFLGRIKSTDSPIQFSYSSESFKYFCKIFDEIFLLQQMQLNMSANLQMQKDILNSPANCLSNLSAQI